MEAWFDGGSRGNPGIAGSGWVLKLNDTTVIQAGCVFIGTHHTNNEAEYSGLIGALEAARAHNATQLTIYGDSLLVINQMNNVWQVRDVNMRRLYTKAVAIARDIPSVTYTHVLRHLNKEADYLSNIAMDSMQTQMGVHLLKTTCKPSKKDGYNGPTIAVRIRREKGKIVQDCDVWVGGAWTKGGWQLMRSDWCNPHHHADKEQALQAYIEYISKNPTLLARIKTDLKGKRLGCFCEPTDAFCHAAWLARVAEEPAAH